MSVIRSRITASELGIALFGITIDDHNHNEVMEQLRGFPNPLFHMQSRDLTLYAPLLPQIDSYGRQDLRIVRVELMFFVFAWIDYLFTRSEGIRNLHGEPGLETFRWYVHSFKQQIEPLGRSQEFLQVIESRLQAYNSDLDHIFELGEKRNRFELEQTFVEFCGAEGIVPDLALYLVLQTHLTCLQNAMVNFLQGYKIQ